jgi:hypothetical protein
VRDANAAVVDRDEARAIQQIEGRVEVELRG